MNDCAEETNQLEAENRRLRERVRALENEISRGRTTLYSIGEGVIAANELGRVTQMNGMAESLTGWREVDALGQRIDAVSRVLDELTQREAENLALRESERRLRCLDASGLLGVILWDIDGKIIDANDTFLQMVGHTRSELEAGRVDWVKMTPPEYQDLDQRAIAELKVNGVSRAPFDKEYLRKDGSRLPVTVAGAMLDEARHNGVAFVLDITERKRAECRLAEQKTLLQNILASSADAIFSLDREYRYTSFNSRHAATMKALYGVEIAVGHSLFEYQQVLADQTQAQCNIDRCLAGENLTDEGFSGEDPRCRTYFEVRHHPIRDAQDQVVGVAVFARDTTEKRRAEDELRQLNAELDGRVAERTAQLEAANQELDAFSFSVSHDLRSPLRAIDGFTQILSDEYAPKLDAEGQRICSTIRESAAKMGRLIEGLLAFARLGRSALHLTQINMREMVTEALCSLAMLHNGRSIDFVVGELAPALADAVLIRQVWVNLISNAIKFTSGRERAEISVQMSERDGACVYAITDNGIGFDMQYQDKLFGVFQRLHSDREFEGTGVGLALVKRIVLRHGGLVWALGQPGVGATFAFSLACAAHERGGL